MNCFGPFQFSDFKALLWSTLLLIDHTFAAQTIDSSEAATLLALDYPYGFVDSQSEAIVGNNKLSYILKTCTDALFDFARNLALFQEGFMAQNPATPVHARG
jgi:hypothetical protein